MYGPNQMPLVTDTMPAAVVQAPFSIPQSDRTTKIKIYLASRYDHLARMQGYKRGLELAGYEVTARWVNGEHEAYENDPHLRGKFAQEDWDDIVRADWVINFTEHPGSGSTRGGRHTEMGIGLALHKRCITIGPRENVFHYLPQIERFETWEDFFWRG